MAVNVPSPFSADRVGLDADADGIRLLVPATYDVLWSLVVLLVVVGTVAAVGAVVVALLRLARRDLAPATAAAAALRHARRVGVAAWVLAATAAVLGVALAAPFVAAAPLWAGLLVPVLLGGSYLTAHAVGELTWPRPTGAVRRAPLVRRTAADVSPGLLRTALRGWALLLLVAGLATGALGGPAARAAAADPTVLPTGAPAELPGWATALAALVVGALLVVATEGVLRLVTARAAVSDADPAWDLALRRVSAHRVLRGAQLLVGGLATSALADVGGLLQVLADGGPVEGVGVALVVVAVVGSLGALGLALVPARPAELAPDATPVEAAPAGPPGVAR